MRNTLALFLCLASASAFAQTKTIWRCEDLDVQSSFTITYDHATKKGNVKMVVAGESSTLKISSYKQYGRPVTIWVKTTQTFMDKNVLMGFRLMAYQRSNPVPKIGTLYYFDRKTGDILGFDEEGHFNCVQI